MSRQFDEDRIARAANFNRRNHLHKIISQYQFRNSNYFRLTKFVRFGFILVSLLIFTFHFHIVSKNIERIESIEITSKLYKHRARYNKYKPTYEVFKTKIKTESTTVNLMGNLEQFKLGETITVNRNLVGKKVSFTDGNYETLKFNLPNDMRYLILFANLPLLFTFIFNDYSRFNYRWNLNVFTWLCPILIIVYYILL